jgi:hypothetical protein
MDFITLAISNTLNLISYLQHYIMVEEVTLLYLCYYFDKLLNIIHSSY